MPHLIQKIIKFFDRWEDRNRAYLSRRPILYAFIGGIFIVLFWRGVWHTADLFPVLSGPVSLAASVIVLLATGLFVSFFIGDRILLTGLKQEKKLAEKTQLEVRTELDVLNEIKVKLEKIEQDIGELKSGR